MAVAGAHRSCGKGGPFIVQISCSIRHPAEPSVAADGDGPFGCNCVFAVIPRGWHPDYGNRRHARGIWLLSPLGGLSANWDCRARSACGGGVGAGCCGVLWVANGAAPPGGRLGVTRNARKGVTGYAPPRAAQRAHFCTYFLTFAAV